MGQDPPLALRESIGRTYAAHVSADQNKGISAEQARSHTTPIAIDYAKGGLRHGGFGGSSSRSGEAWAVAARAQQLAETLRISILSRVGRMASIFWN
jgi:hypothetical protein